MYPFIEEGARIRICPKFIAQPEDNLDFKRIFVSGCRKKKIYQSFS